MSDTTMTQQESAFNTARLTNGGHNIKPKSYPRLRLLYHVDIDRIGAVTGPGEELCRGEWQAVGRRAPLFLEQRENGMERPLGDPTISRQQILIRWVKSASCFEVEPVAAAKRRISVLTPKQHRDWDGKGLPEVQEISGRTRLPPGSCIAIEDRLLIGLEVAPRNCFEAANRLNFVGESALMWQLRQDITEVAEFQQPALILGHTGVGKELVARAIHDQSNRSNGPFVTVNCAALPDHLVESILFGHKKGAFTGADSSQVGHFRAADGGTILLDELGEMPMLVQSKLLRVVQDGLITPVGQHTSIQVNVRLIAATNRDPLREIKEHRLREDLYHRLSAHLIRVPSLTERNSDVPELFTHFLRQLRGEHGKLGWLWTEGVQWRKAIPMSFFIKLMATSWTGNVRELQNIAARTARRNLNTRTFISPELTVVQDPQREIQTAPIQPTPKASAQPLVNAHDEAQLAAASEALDLARKTIVKLITPSELERLWRVEDRTHFSDALATSASTRLFEMLEKHAFKQRNVATEIEISPSTLLKLMQRFGLPRANALELDVIERALAQAGGDVEKAARTLQVSFLSLKKRLALLRLQQKGRKT